MDFEFHKEHSAKARRVLRATGHAYLHWLVCIGSHNKELAFK